MRTTFRRVARLGQILPAFLVLLALLALPRVAQAAACDVTLISWGAKKINVIKALKSLTGLSLADTQKLVATIPAVVLSGVTAAGAQYATGQLEIAGAEVKKSCIR